VEDLVQETGGVATGGGGGGGAGAVGCGEVLRVCHDVSFLSRVLQNGEDGMEVGPLVVVVDHWRFGCCALGLLYVIDEVMSDSQAKICGCGARCGSIKFRYR
jgi:hypothetical protein